MAVNESRSMTEELLIGTTEGSYKSSTPDRGGDMSLDTVLAKQHLSSVHFDALDAPLDVRHSPSGGWRKHSLGRRSAAPTDAPPQVQTYMGGVGQ